jgi:diguanylate cyclase (GGDEF)-like protein
MNPSLQAKILQSPRLPSLPTIAIEVIELVQQKDVNIKQIAETIQHDPALSTKILKTVNSSFYGQAHSISTVSHALVVLGLNSVKTLALGFSLVGNLAKEGSADFDHMTFWKRSLYSASAARLIGKKTGLVQQEEAFLGALLQDLGMLAMNQTLGSSYRAVLAQVGPHHLELRAAEREVLDTDHTEIGAALAEYWKLPPILVAPIRYHEDADNGPEELQHLLRCVQLGGRVADIFVTDVPGDALAAYQQLGEHWFNFTKADTDELLKSIHEATVEMRRLFDLPTGALQNPDAILSQANEALMQITLQQQQQTAQLEKQNAQLTREVLTDALTGVANRRHFNDFIISEFANASDVEHLSVLFFDTDHFKKFNDTYGHQTGDRVLVELADTLSKSVPQGALVARYGGEEFAVVLPNTSRIEAAKMAEHVRQTIEKTIVQSDDGKPLSITASIGVATYDGTFYARAEQLVKAADQAVYAAKAGGRNCVRVFTPKVKQPDAERVA